MSRLPHLERLFPNLRTVGYAPQSPPTAQYNCVAWAADDTTRVWQGSNVDGYWPPGALEGYSFDALTSAFEQLRYSVCTSGALEDGYIKVALYGDERGKWTHVARQLQDGRWTSKIGGYEDIVHRTPFALTGSDYGNVLIYMRRELATGQLSLPPLPPTLRKPTRRGRKGRKRS